MQEVFGNFFSEFQKTAFHAVFRISQILSIIFGDFLQMPVNAIALVDIYSDFISIYRQQLFQFLPTAYAGERRSGKNNAGNHGNRRSRHISAA